MLLPIPDDAPVMTTVLPHKRLPIDVAMVCVSTVVARTEVSCQLLDAAIPLGRAQILEKLDVNRVKRMELSWISSPDKTQEPMGE